ncbi:MAG TPA: DNA alkylation repair protein [Rubrivivax sp.]
MAATGAAANHDEVVAALRAIGDPRRGEAIRRDRGSQLQYLGIGVPALRARVRQGVSFSALPAAQLLELVDELWRTSPYGDVLFAALETLAPIVRKEVAPGVWPVVRHWHERIDNWCHSDVLAGVYSRVLEARFDEVYPQLEAWNRSPGEWPRRLSLTSLIHYTGQNAVFLPPERMLPLLSACVDDHRKFVALALGWVLRELGRKHPGVAAQFLAQHAARMSAPAFARAIERHRPEERMRLSKHRQSRSA